MFCSFDKAPQIMRLFCTARVVEFDEPDFGEWIRRMGEKRVTAMRAVIVLDVFKVGCFFPLVYFITLCTVVLHQMHSPPLSTSPYINIPLTHPPLGPNILRLRRPLPRHQARP